MAWRPRWNLLTRILLGFLAVGLLPLGVASYRLLGMNRAAMTEQVLRTHAVAAQTTGARVEAFLDARREVARGAATNPALQTHPRSAEGTRVLADLLRSPLGVVAVSVRNTEGGEVVRAQRKELAGPIGEILEVTAEPPAGAAALPVLHRGDVSLLRLDAPLAEAQGHLLVVYDLSPLARHLRPQELGELADLLLVDAAGGVVLGAPEALATFPPGLIRAALSGKISGSGRFAEGTEEPVLGAYAPVANTPWTVLSRQPARVAEATAQQVRRQGLLAIAVAVALTLLAAGIAHRTLVRPIRALIEAQQRLAGPGGEAPTGGGEIQQLRASFELLERRLREKEELGKVFLGRYQVMEVAGEGAMGTVFRGWDPALKRPVALKTVRFDSTTPERAEHATRLLQEAVAVAHFNHPNIVGIYDVQESPEVAFLSMEFVDGESLDGYLARHPDPDVAEIIALGLGIARGLAAAHGRGILHRDIKPANVLLSHEGEIKIADFGISEMMTSLGPDPTMVFGTPGFIPPETLIGKGYSPAGDCFALGVTLYRLWTGRLPFSGENFTEVIQKTVAEPLVRPSALLGALPEPGKALDALIVALLAKEPDQRPTAEEAVARLEAMAPEPGVSWAPRPGNAKSAENAGSIDPMEFTRPGSSTRRIDT
jgi:hypothetical protein